MIVMASSSVLLGHHRPYWAENFLLHHLHVFGYAGEDGWRDEAFTGVGLTAVGYGGPLLYGIIEQAFVPVKMPIVDDAGEVRRCFYLFAVKLGDACF